MKARSKVFSQGQVVKLALRDIDSIREILAPPKPYPSTNYDKRGRREIRARESIWKAGVSMMLNQFKTNSLRLAMTRQMDFTWKDVARKPIQELIRMVVKRRGYGRWSTAQSKK